LQKIWKGRKKSKKQEEGERKMNVWTWEERRGSWGR
jgi:hypothetical protein